MAKQTRTVTVFGNDLDVLLRRAGISSVREYADQCRVSYKYISQLRTSPERRPGRLYVDLLKPFTRVKILGLAQSHQMSLRHRGKPMSLAECQSLFPGLRQQEILESIKLAAEVRRTAGPLSPPEEASTEQGRPQFTGPGEQSSRYRRVFVGRERELAQLQAAFSGAVSGQGALMMVVGEPGIGKTALCEKFAGYVESTGGLVLTGHCYSERTMSLPYLAFVEALRSRVNGRDRAYLRAELGRGAADLARIVPEIKDKLGVRLRPKGDPEEERYRLMESAVHFLGSIATVQPLLLVLEDLHNADKGTLEMLTHLSHSIGDARVLVVATYRDVEVDRTHPLSIALAELRRVPVFQRLLLRGLNLEEVDRMCSAITGRETPRRLSEAICKQTEGNPLFVQEVIRYFAEEGLIASQGKIVQSSPEPVEMKIPDGLRDVIGRRLSRLTQSCNRVLGVAAVIGRDFPLHVLQKVAGISDEELFNAVEEAVRAAVIEERPAGPAAVNYRFAHAFFRQTLYEEIIAPRRIRLHQQTARVLEEAYAGRLEEHAATLAEHFSHSSDPADLRKSVSYGEMAAKLAVTVYAYGEAVRSLEQALKVQQTLDPHDEPKQIDLLLDLSEALNIAGEPQRSINAELPTAFALAERTNDSERASRICTLAIQAFAYSGGPSLYGTPEFAHWVERADRYANPNTAARVWADFALARVRNAEGTKTGQQLFVSQAQEMTRQALDVARKVGDSEVFWYVAYNSLVLWSPRRMQELRQLADELNRMPRTGVSAKTLASGLFLIGWFCLDNGYRQAAHQAHAELKQLAERTGQGNAIILSTWAGSVELILEGRLAEAMGVVRNIPTRGEELGIPVYANVTGIRTLRACLAILLGDNKEIVRILENGIIDDSPSMKAACLAKVGREAETVAILDREVVARPNFGSDLDNTWIAEDCFFLDTAVAVRHIQATGMLYDRLQGTGCYFPQGWYGIYCLPQYFAAAAALLGRPDEARKHYQKAIRVCTEMRFRPGLALTCLGLAELLFDHYPADREEALQHLDFAIKEFREMKMQPALERALKRKETLKA